jgi:hypothetical protein
VGGAVDGHRDEPMDQYIIGTTYFKNEHDPTCISKGDVLKNCNIQFGSFSNVML